MNLFTFMYVSNREFPFGEFGWNKVVFTSTVKDLFKMVAIKQIFRGDSEFF